MSWIEVLGFLTGALCVWLVVRRNIWNFPVGMANNVFFLILFWRSGLFAGKSTNALVPRPADADG